MPHYRLTIECRQLERRWTYGFFCEGASAAAMVADWTSGFMLSRLSALHHELTTITRVTAARVSSAADPTPAREVSRKALLRPGEWAGTSTPDLVEASIVLNLVSAGGPARELKIRGVADDAVRRSATTGLAWPGPIILNAIDPLLVSIVAPPPALVRSRFGPTLAGYTWRDVKQLSAAAGSENAWTLVTTVQAHGLTAGWRVLFGGEIDCNVESLKGEFTVLSVPSVDSLVVAARYRGTGAIQAPRHVRVRRSEYQYFPIIVAGSGFKEFATRNTGSGSSKRGRTSGKSCR